MIIRANDKEINVKNILSDFLKKGSKNYPALRFEFENEITSSDVATLLSGSFEILDDDGNVLGIHEGYNTLKSINITIGKMTTADEEIASLEAELASVKAENNNYKTEIDALESENAELLFNNTTNENYDIVAEDTTTTQE